MGLAISRVISRVIRRDGYDYEAADPLELRHLGMSDLEETPNVQSSAPALGDRASWHWKVQVGRTFAAAPHQHRMPLHISRHQWRDLLRALFVVIVRALFVVIALVACIYMREVVRGRADFYFPFCYEFTKYHGWKRPSPAHERPYWSAHKPKCHKCDDCEDWCNRRDESCDDIEHNERNSIPQKTPPRHIPDCDCWIEMQCMVERRCGVAAAWLHWWALVRAAFGDGYCVLLHTSWARYVRHTKEEDKHLAELICTTTYAPPRAVAWRS